MKTKYYIFKVEGGVEPEILGPYKNSLSRDVAAKRYKWQEAAKPYRKANNEDSIFWLNQTGQTLSTGSYSALFMTF